MKEQFVTYEIALKLKEKGFNKPCLYPYVDTGSIDNSYVNFIDWNLKYENTVGYCSAPLWQQVIDWFEKTYEIYISINIDRTSAPKFNYSIYQYEYSFHWYEHEFNSELFSDKKEAYAEAIKRVLTLI
jgi:hypothetical protein